MITINLRDFAALVNTCAPVCSRDDLLPVFNAIHFFTRGGQLFATSTDRYMFIRAAGPETSHDFDALIPLAACRQVIATFKVGRKLSATVSLQRDADVVTVTGDGELIGLTSGTLKLPAVQGRFPDSDRMFHDAITGKDTNDQPYGLANNLLSKLPDNADHVIANGANRPVVFIARGWIAMIMPRRVADGQPELNLWRDRTAPATTPAEIGAA